MRVEELRAGIDIYLSNEEKTVLEKIVDGSQIEIYKERDRIIIDELVKKDLVSKFSTNNSYLIIRND